MSTTISETDFATAAAPQPVRRPLGRRVMHVVRRAHLYFGLFLVPWAVLYGVSSFPFNHPTAFADQPAVTFGNSATAGTPFETRQTPLETAVQLVAQLNEKETAKEKDARICTLVRPEAAKYNREFAFATVKAKGEQISILFDVVQGGGSIRSRPEEPVKAIEKAPFATGNFAPPSGPRSGKPRGEAPAFAGSLHERVRDSIPTVLERSGFKSGEITVTSVPDVVFFVESDGKLWKATYNSLTGSLGGQPADEVPPEPISTRRFLTRLHSAHGYPSSVGARWGWALVVDVMAFVMVFWGVSGLFMWWQIKATRRIGFVVLLLSAAAATALGFGMYAAMSFS